MTTRADLHYGEGKSFKPSIRTSHLEFPTPTAGPEPDALSSRQGANVMPDLANAMKINPELRYS